MAQVTAAFYGKWKKTLPKHLWNLMAVPDLSVGLPKNRRPAQEETKLSCMSSLHMIAVVTVRCVLRRKPTPSFFQFLLQSDEGTKSCIAPFISIDNSGSKDKFPLWSGLPQKLRRRVVVGVLEGATFIHTIDASYLWLTREKNNWVSWWTFSKTEMSQVHMLTGTRLTSISIRPYWGSVVDSTTFFRISPGGQFPQSPINRNVKTTVPRT